MSKVIPAAIGGAIACLALTAPAHALNARTWISGAGVDQAGCGPIANPCRTLQYAHDQTGAGGEINVKDSAGYGAVSISKAISIISDGHIAGVLGTAQSYNAVTINVTPDDRVVLRGLTIEGSGNGYNGITMGTGELLIQKCTVQNFKQFGAFISTASGKSVSVAIQDSDFSLNGSYGISFYGSQGGPDQTLSIRNSTFQSNGAGLGLDGPSTARFTLTNVSVLKNGGAGVNIHGSNAVSLDNVTASQNVRGIAAYTGITLIGRSTIVGNTTTGMLIVDGATVLSYRDNHINANAKDVDVPIPTKAPVYNGIMVPGDSGMMAPPLTR